jgi:hypothetical protein
VQAEAPDLARDLLRDIREGVDQLLDLKTMITTRLMRDRALLNQIFLEAGAEEFRFIIRSGSTSASRSAAYRRPSGTSRTTRGSCRCSAPSTAGSPTGWR